MFFLHFGMILESINMVISEHSEMIMLFSVHTVKNLEGLTVRSYLNTHFIYT